MPGATPQTTFRFAIYGPIERQDLQGLCDRVCDLLAANAGARTALCDVESVPADAVTVDAVARLQVAANRRGCQIRLQGARPELSDLIAFMGLADVICESARPATPPAGAAAARTAGRPSRC